MGSSTSTRKEERERARAERERKQQEEALHAQRKRRLFYLGGGLLVLIAVVAIVIAVASGGSSSPSGAASAGGVKGANAVKAQYAGIPQKGNVLGAGNAPATMMVFADLQCPFCAQFETQMFPKIVSRYVRPGKLKIVFQPIAIIGQDSVAGARASASAGQQNKMFDYASLFYLNQGQENTGYITDSFLTNLAKSVPGLDVSKWRADLNSQGVSTMLSQAQSAARTAGVNSTPTFLVARRGQPLTRFDVNAYTPQEFYPKLDSLTK